MVAHGMRPLYRHEGGFDVGYWAYGVLSTLCLRGRVTALLRFLQSRLAFANPIKFATELQIIKSFLLSWHVT